MLLDWTPFDSEATDREVTDREPRLGRLRIERLRSGRLRIGRQATLRIRRLWEATGGYGRLREATDREAKDR